MSAWESWCGRPLSFALAALAVAMPIEAGAEPTEKPEVIEVSGKRSGYDLDGTSSATKTDTLLLDVPQSMSVITSQLIDDQSMRSMADVVRYVPGVQMAQGEGHRDAPVLRGNASTADFYVDGIRDDVQYYRDLYNVGTGRGAERSERDGVRAWRRWRRDQPRDRAGQRADRARADVHGRRIRSDDAARSIVGQAIRDDLAVRLNAMYENSDDYRRFKDLDRYGINPTATYDVLGRHAPESRLRTLRRPTHSSTEACRRSTAGPLDGEVQNVLRQSEASHAEAEGQSHVRGSSNTRSRRR